MPDDPVASMREAVRLSPDNLPLRRLLIESLLGRSLCAEAEAESRAAIQRWSEEPGLQVLLARSFAGQGKSSQALVVLEQLSSTSQLPPAGMILQARLLHADGEIEKAVAAYRRAVREEPELADEDLAERIGVPTDGSAADADAAVVDGRLREAPIESDGVVDIERPRIGFSDVGGMEELKEEIRLKIIHPLAHPELYQAYGKPIGGGILLYGPPGCGKTHLARATAGEIKAGFINVGLETVLDMWLGNSEKNLHQVFAKARRNRPCVLFFDEVDALAASRADFRSTAGRHVINQFLAELDGAKESNDGVLILAATNAPWHLDPAFKRPGRFDRILFVPPPDLEARTSILRVLLRGKPVKDIDHLAVSKRTDDFSGADLKALVDQAIELKIQDAIRSGAPTPLTTKDLSSVATKIKPSTSEWFANAKNFALYANQGGQYNEILRHLERR